MSKYYGKALLLIIAICLAVVSHFLLPFIEILEVALIVLIILLTVWVVSLVDDQIHLHRVRRQLREAHLRRMKSQLPPRQSRY